MIKHTLIKYVRWWRAFKDWVNRMEAIGLEELRLAQLAEEERQTEIKRLKQIELARLREVEEAEQLKFR